MIKEPQNLLVVRTDRVGDVVLTTPVLKFLRKKYSSAHIAFMVRPYVYDLVKDNPYVDEILVYDKDKKHRGWLASFLYSQALRKKKFDLVLIFNPTLRVHLMSCFARIPVRIGYSRKWGRMLLTHNVEDKKHEGKKHEYEYCFDVLKSVGIENTVIQDLYVTESRFEHVSLKKAYVVIHPFASCPSKVWPHEKFKELVFEILSRWEGNVVLVGEGQNSFFSSFYHDRVVNLIGKLKLDQLAYVLRLAACLISNDSGPVHMASAVETPSVVIFGRNNKGLSPTRWGPTYSKSVIIHKDVGCEVCLAHKCQIGFLCLNEISVNDVWQKTKMYIGQN